MNVEPDKENTGHWSTVKSLLPFLWAPQRADLKLRVVGAMLLLILAKLIGVYVPFLFKDAVDALTGQGDGLSQAALLVVVPTSLILAYGAAR